MSDLAQLVITTDKRLPKSKSVKQNVLHNYRSYTYGFTLSSIKRSEANNPALYRKSNPEFIILKSGGKGTKGMPTAAAEVIAAAEQALATESTNLSATVQSVAAKKNTVDALKSTSQGFNQYSPGRFDMYMDALEISSFLGFSQESNTSLPNQIRFEVIEPFSINGFIEALNVASVSAGYPNHTQGRYLLAVEFKGYPDNDQTSFPEPRIIDGTTRYIPFQINTIDVDVSERGTRYSVTGTPLNETGFGVSNQLKQPVNITGGTVKEILEDLMSNLNKQITTSESAIKAGVKVFDEYEIVFPELDLDKGWVVDKNNPNVLGAAKVSEVLKKDKSNYKFPDPADPNTPATGYNEQGKKQPTADQKEAQPEYLKLTPGTGNSKQTIQFKESAQIHSLIGAVIRDSTFGRDLLKNLANKVPGVINKFGLVNYFLCRIETEIKDQWDPVSGRYPVKYRYVVTPWKVHVTTIDRYLVPSDINLLNLLRLTHRDYKYLYSGQNSDILTFNLQFNNLYYESIPPVGGTSNQVSAQSSAAKEGQTQQKLKGDILAEVYQENPVPVRLFDASVQNQQPAGGSGGQLQDDQYFVLARNMHNAIVNSAKALTVCDVEIVGDPLYLGTAGMGNYNPKLASKDNGETSDAEINPLYGEQFVSITFRNPVDILPLEKGGSLEFSKYKVPFSGIYRMFKCVSTFREGVFKQKLQLTRVPGKLETEDTETSSILDIVSNREITTKPGSETTPDTSPADAPSSRANEATLPSWLSRGLPSLGNFAAVAGGGLTALALLKQVSGGVSNGIGKITSAASVFGGSIPGGTDQSASGIRLQTAGIIPTNLGTSGQINQLGDATNLNNGSFAVASSIQSKAAAVTDQVAVAGSGIGEGSSLTGSRSLFTQSSPLTQAASASETNNLLAAAGSTVGSANLVNSIAAQTSRITRGLPSDTQALANRLGINPSQLSGLSSNKVSNLLNQVDSATKLIPQNVNLSSAMNRGLNLDIPSARLANLPATAPNVTAPLPQVNKTDMADLVKSGGPLALAMAFGVNSLDKLPGSAVPANLKADILSSANKLTNPLSSLPIKSLSDAAAQGGKLLANSQQYQNITGLKTSVEANLSGVQNIVGQTVATGANLASSAPLKLGSKSSENPLLKYTT
jgi:hypothetical protein